MSPVIAANTENVRLQNQNQPSQVSVEVMTTTTMMMVMMMGAPARRKTAELARGVGGVNVQLRVEIVDGKSAQER